MKHLIPAAVILIAALATLAGCAGGTPPVWMTDHGLALQQARESGRPVLIQVSATWCGFCDRMDRETFAAPALKDQLDQFVLLRIDVDANPLLAERYGTGMLPTTVILGSDGKVLTAEAGFQDRRQFGAFLAGALAQRAAAPAAD